MARGPQRPLGEVYTSRRRHMAPELCYPASVLIAEVIAPLVVFIHSPICVHAHKPYAGLGGREVRLGSERGVHGFDGGDFSSGQDRLWVRRAICSAHHHINVIAIDGLVRHHVLLTAARARHTFHTPASNRWHCRAGSALAAPGARRRACEECSPAGLLHTH
jgi:hypothetical protein